MLEIDRNIVKRMLCYKLKVKNKVRFYLGDIIISERIIKVGYSDFSDNKENCGIETIKFKEYESFQKHYNREKRLKRILKIPM